MKKSIAVIALAIGLITGATSAQAWWYGGGSGVRVYVGPGYNYGPRYYGGPYNYRPYYRSYYGYGCRWIPGHYNYNGFWIPGHRSC